MIMTTLMGIHGYRRTSWKMRLARDGVLAAAGAATPAGASEVFAGLVIATLISSRRLV